MIAGSLVPYGLCGNDDTAVFNGAVQNTAVSQKDDPLCTHRNHILKGAYTGRGSKSCFTHGKAVSFVAYFINGPDTVHILRLGNDLAIQPMHNSSKQTVGKDGNDSFRKSGNPLMHKMRFDNSISVKVKLF